MKEYAAASEEFEWVLEKEPDAEGVEQLLEVSRAHLKGYDK
jgi:hypothetical protein